MIISSDLLETRRAWFSDCGAYRYRLDIKIQNAAMPSAINFLMLNPSTADHLINDPTVERCERRAKMLGFDRLIITNLFALRSTDPDGLLVAADPIGPENDEMLKSVFERASMTVCAWGTRPNKLFVFRRMRSLVRILPPALHCLKISKDGFPCHPLYLSYDLAPQRYYIDRC